MKPQFDIIQFNFGPVTITPADDTQPGIIGRILWDKQSGYLISFFDKTSIIDQEDLQMLLGKLKSLDILYSDK